MPEKFVCRWCKQDSEIDFFRSRFPKICMECYRSHIHKKARGPVAKYNRLKYNAKKLGVVMDLSMEQYEQLLQRSCHYCDLPVIGRSSTEATENTGSGLDRVVPGQGYTIDNVVPSCFYCNRVKSDWFTHDEMKVIGVAIRSVLLRR